MTQHTKLQPGCKQTIGATRYRLTFVRSMCPRRLCRRTSEGIRYRSHSKRVPTLQDVSKHIVEAAQQGDNSNPGKARRQMKKCTTVKNIRRHCGLDRSIRRICASEGTHLRAKVETLDTLLYKSKCSPYFGNDVPLHHDQGDW